MRRIFFLRSAILSCLFVFSSFAFGQTTTSTQTRYSQVYAPSPGVICQRDGYLAEIQTPIMACLQQAWGMTAVVSNLRDNPAYSYPSNLFPLLFDTTFFGVFTSTQQVAGLKDFCPSGYTDVGGVCTQDPSAVCTSKNLGEPGECVGNPCNPATGNKYQVETDYVDSGPYPLTFKRYYNSGTDVTQTYIGAQWRHTYDRFIKDFTTGTRSTAFVQRHDGKTLFFTSVSGGAWTSDAKITEVLQKLISGKWQLTTNEDEIETYDAAGKLESVRNRAGLEHTLTYSTGGTSPSIAPWPDLLIKVTDSFGREINFNYDSLGRITKMIDAKGNEFLYAYSAGFNALASVTYPDATPGTPGDNPVRQYHYNESAYTSSANLPGALTGITDEKNIRFAIYQYHADGRAKSTEHANSAQKVELAYPSGTTSDVTAHVDNSQSETRTYTYQTTFGAKLNTAISGAACPTCGPAATSYDSNGFVTSRTDWNGTVADYVYDSRGLETSRTEASNRTNSQGKRIIATTWHSTFRLPTEILEKDGSGTTLRKTEFTHDVSGNVLTRTITDVPATKSRTWTYTYNANGSVLTVNGPRTDVSDVTTYTYNANNATCGGTSVTGCRGQIATITNAASHVTTITDYNAHGQPLSITDPNGLVTTLTYDTLGRLASRTAGGETTAYTYDAVGQLTRVTLPDTSYLDYTYDDAHRLTQIDDNLGNRVAYTLDWMGNRTQEDVRDPLNVLTQTRSRVYSSLSRLSQDIGAASQTTTYTYDSQGNVTAVNGPLSGAGDTVGYTYDFLNRLTRMTDPGSGQTDYAYNPLSQTTSVTDPRTFATSYTINALNDLTQLVSPDTGTATSVYDAAGNLTSRTDAKSQQITYTYDVLNRVTAINHTGASSLDVTLQYDQSTNQKGRLTTVTDSGGTTVYTYDTQGRMTSETRTINSIAYVTGYRYNADGLLDRITYPGGRTVDYSFDSLGRISQITTTSGGTVTLASSVTYQPFGGVKGFTFGNSTNYTRDFDQDGRISTFTLGTQTRVAGYDDASRISFLTEQGNPSNTDNYGYDLLNRLTSFTGPSTSQSFTYDAVGNRSTQVIGASTYNYTYSGSSNRISTVSGPTARTFTHDANGSITADTINSSTYDARGRLASVTTGAGTTNYKINFFGQRVRKTDLVDDRVYHYDNNGKLIAESTAAGTIQREYVYLGDMPVAVLVGGTPYFIHADQINTPRAVADGTGQIVWLWESDPFGATVPNEDPDADTVLFSLNLRFPGQYFDKETNVHYNYFRDYDSNIGRYTQSDPIGLSGGINTYAYVEGNPISRVDPLGLASLIFQVGSSWVPGVGGEGNVGAYISVHNGRLDVGLYSQGGMSAGYQTPGVSAQVGLMKGDVNTIRGITRNVNVAAPLLCGTAMTDDQRNLLGMSFGAGSKYGASLTHSETGAWSMGEAFGRLFERIFRRP
jgi:RHS repeat-associated protein